MLLKSRQLLGLPVSSKSGKYLGKIIGFEFEAETQTVLRYEVRRLPFFGASFLIHRHQVISIGADKMTVEDLYVSDESRITVLAGKAATGEQSASLSSQISE